MAGSLKWQIYQADNTVRYAVFLDESNGEAAGFSDLTADGNQYNTLPKGVRMRYANVIHPPTRTRRRIYLPLPNSDLADGGSVTLPLFSGNTASGAVFVASSFVGEKGRVPIAADTGLNDGDLS